MLSSTNEFKEHHKRYIKNCMEGSSPSLPSNFRMLDEKFVRIPNHEDWCLIGSLVNCDKSERPNIVKKINGVFKNELEV